MKEFIHTIKQMFLVGRTNMINYLLYSLFGGIVGIIITLRILAFNGGTEGYRQIGALIAVTINLIYNIFVGSLTMEQDFNLAVSMGKTRKYFTPAKYILQVLNLVLIIAMATAIGFVEDLLYPVIYPGIVCGYDVVDFLLNPAVLFLATFGGAMLVLFWGALVLKFTAKVYGVISILWITLCAVVSKISEAIANQQNNIWGKIGRGCISLIENITTFQLVIIGICVLGAGYFISVILLRKQQVTR